MVQVLDPARGNFTTFLNQRQEKKRKKTEVMI